MILKGNEMIINRNESFTIDRRIVNRDGSPFVVSSKWSNPYICITIASTRYNQPNRYIANWWLDLQDLIDENGERISLPRLNSTTVRRIPNESPLHFRDDSPFDILYYVEDDGMLSNPGHHYYYLDDSRMLRKYEFRLIHHFQHSVTRTWVEQNYVYSISLFSGDDTYDYLRNLYKSVFAVQYVPPELSSEELYLAIRNKDESLVKNLNYERPLVNIGVDIPILSPTKLTVMSDPHGNLMTKIVEQNIMV